MILTRISRKRRISSPRAVKRGVPSMMLGVAHLNTIVSQCELAPYDFTKNPAYSSQIRVAGGF
mgnify:CR=1 FL=1